jgi:hypothetical protein
MKMIRCVDILISSLYERLGQSGDGEQKILFVIRQSDSVS